MESTKKRPPYLILCLIALVAALALGITNAITAGPIEQHRMDALSAAYNAVLPAENYTEISYDAAKYKNLTGLYSAEDANGNLLGYVVSASQQGYAGPVAVTFALDAQGTVTAVKVGDNEFVETAGFGARALNEEFAAQFPGIQAVEGGAFEALSGATFTSKAVLGNTNEAMQAVAEAVFQKESAGVVFGKNEKAAAASTAQADPAALTAGARMTGSAQGFAGNVTVDFALDDSLAIEGLTISAPDETEGLGKRAEEAEFAAQFNGKALPVSLEDIEAISGATITSTAVVDAINAATVKVEQAAPGSIMKGSAQGFAGNVSVTYTLDDAMAIQDMAVSAPDETEGLGKRAEEAEFAAQFNGKALPVSLEDIEAITGATITSTAVVDAVNAAVPSGNSGAAPVEILEEVDGHTLGAQNGSAVVSADSSYSGTLSGSFVFENGQLVSGSLATAAPETAAPEAVEEPVRMEADPNALTAKAVGFSGEDVTVSITLDEGGAVASMTVDAAAETAGLGQKAMEDAFTSQFIGKTGPFVLGENVDAITGATITSTAVVDAVNSLLPAGAAEEQPAAEPAAEAPAAGEVLTAKAVGFSGEDVTVSITLDESGAVASMTVDAAAETAGLGQKAMEEEFTSQFIGKTGPFTLGGDVDAVTGATITSTAVVDAVNSLLPAGAAEEKPAAEAAAETPASDALTAKVTGFSGEDVTVSITLDDNGAVASMTVDAAAETEGLGQKAMEEEFTSQFIGKTGPFVLGENVEAITGATITSAVVVRAVNSLLPEAKPADSSAEAPAGEVLTAKAVGFSGEDVTVSITLDESGAVASMTVDAAAETAGLGQLAMEDAFTSQFIGKTAPFVLGENVDAITGATITSTAVVDAVNSLFGSSEEAAPAAEAAVPAVEIDPDAVSMKVTGVNGKDVTVAIKKDESGAITYMAVDATAETAGLGQKTMEEDFTSQFIGKTGPFVLGENVEAVSGATITSAVVVKAVNALLTAPAPVAEPAVEIDPDAAWMEITGVTGKPVTVAVKTDDQGTVTYMVVDASSETEGLGKKTMEEAFTSQFIGKAGPFVLGENVEAVSGATVTSAAVTNAVNSLLGTFPAAVQTAESRSAADISAERLAAAVEEAPKPERVPVFEAGEHTLTVKGFNGGDIAINVTLDDQGTVTALTVDASSETEGLGQKASEEAFTSQFLGKTAPFALGEDLDTVSGATITSAAVVNALNSLFK